MKQIKIKFVGFWSSFNYEDFYLYKIMKKYYDVEISDNPDYVICSLFGKKYEYCGYSQPRIMYSGENYIPDLNLVDYAICSYPIALYDRVLSMPCERIDDCIQLEKKRVITREEITQKKLFANLVTAHESEDNYRGIFFKKLSQYKRVESAGIFLNNMPNCETVSMFDGSKMELLRKCKFTICFESTKHEGFITEKIVDAFNAHSIPIYYGSDSIAEIFNPKAFINCSDYESMDEVIERIIEIDNDDALFFQILNQPVLKENHYFTRKYSEAENFIRNIFDQPIDKCYRRSRVYMPKAYDDYLSGVNADGHASSDLLAAYKRQKALEKREKQELFKKLCVIHSKLYMFLWYIKNIILDF